MHIGNVILALSFHLSVVTADRARIMERPLYCMYIVCTSVQMQNVQLSMPDYWFKKSITADDLLRIIGHSIYEFSMNAISLTNCLKLILRSPASSDAKTGISHFSNMLKHYYKNSLYPPDDGIGGGGGIASLLPPFSPIPWVFLSLPFKRSAVPSSLGTSVTRSFDLPYTFHCNR